MKKPPPSMEGGELISPFKKKILKLYTKPFKFMNPCSKLY